jgi:hypothetical protein
MAVHQSFLFLTPLRARLTQVILDYGLEPIKSTTKVFFVPNIGVLSTADDFDVLATDPPLIHLQETAPNGCHQIVYHVWSRRVFGEAR